jgi:hypothetical protein
MFKRVINCVVLAASSAAALVFSLGNDSIIFVNLFPFGTGIEVALWAYTIALLFAGALLGILAAYAFGRKKIQK